MKHVNFSFRPITIVVTCDLTVRILASSCVFTCCNLFSSVSDASTFKHASRPFIHDELRSHLRRIVSIFCIFWLFFCKDWLECVQLILMFIISLIEKKELLYFNKIFGVHSNSKSARIKWWDEMKKKEWYWSLKSVEWNQWIIIWNKLLKKL